MWEDSQAFIDFWTVGVVEELSDGRTALYGQVEGFQHGVWMLAEEIGDDTLVFLWLQGARAVNHRAADF